MPVRTKEFYAKMNRVMEKLAKTNLSKNESKYTWLLFRETFGYGNLKVRISGVRISEFTGILESHVSRTEQRLKNRNIIIVSNKYKGFNHDIAKWRKLPLLVTSEKLPLLVRKVTATGKKKVTATGNLRTKKKETYKKGRVVLKKLNYKEMEKLEGKNWLKQVMWQDENFKESFINEIFKTYSFMQCYDTYIAYQNAHDVRDKEAWFLAKLQRGPAPKE